ncbi:MAG: hypothetical protein RBT63_07930 [Bdellovibrionales bacterium]|nr:hypothetical protein [Bdellovibrionales bacterium]
MQAPLLLSCKLTNAVLKFLERRGEDLEPLYERFDWPLHYLRDSSSWLEADRLEYVLAILEEIYGRRVASETGGDFFEYIGHISPQLRAWGALDSVLRIVPGVRDLYQQPDRFLSSFISPQPQIQGLHHTHESTVFRIGFWDDRMPRAARYLKAALESLPEFIGKPRTHVVWNHGHVSIEWSERQVPFVSDSGRLAEGDGPALSPDLLRTILLDLATAQRELEGTRRLLQDRDNEVSKLREQIEQSHVTPRALESLSESPNVQQALHEIYKLGDYFARAQQIVTLLRNPNSATTKSGLITTATAEALIKRTSWDRVSQETPIAIRRASVLLQGGDVEFEPEVPAEAKAEIDVVGATVPEDAIAVKKASAKSARLAVPAGKTAGKTTRNQSFFDM